uniref:Uncharacterized protein n=1 Tax=Vespula pensylvanica TaxID=30213 RepID=A0A834PAY2_VESPE|nr:hypothetical protein H0235_002917 [Vespula pensylvanica]
MGDTETSEEETTELARNARRCRNVSPLRSRRKRKKKKKNVCYGIIACHGGSDGGDGKRGSKKLTEDRNVEKTMQFANANHKSYAISDVSQLSEVFHCRRFESYDLIEVLRENYAGRRESKRTLGGKWREVIILPFKKSAILKVTVRSPVKTEPPICKGWNKLFSFTLVAKRNCLASGY